MKRRLLLLTLIIFSLYLVPFDSMANKYWSNNYVDLELTLKLLDTQEPCFQQAQNIDELLGEFPSIETSGTLDDAFKCFLDDHNCSQITESETIFFIPPGMQVATSGPYSVAFQEQLFEDILTFLEENTPICSTTNTPKKLISLNVGWDIIGPPPPYFISLSATFACCTECNPNASPDFSFDLDNLCSNGWCAIATADDTDVPNHKWELIEALDYINPIIDDGMVVNTVEDVDNVSFCWLNQAKRYFIRHTISDVCYEEKSTYLLVPSGAGASIFHFEDEDKNERNTFCADEVIYLDGRESFGEDQHNIGAWRRPIGSLPAGSLDPDDYSWFGGPGWVLPSSPVNDIIDLTDLYGNLSSPPYSQGSNLTFDPGYEYLVQFAISDVSECVLWTPSFKTFTVETCCDELQPPENLHINCTTQAFAWNEVDGADGYEVMFSYNGGATCCNSEENWQLTATYTTTDNNLNFSEVTINWICGNWKVKALCGEEAESAWSDIACLYHCPFTGDDKRISKYNKETFEVNIYPNPSTGSIFVDLPKSYDSHVSIDVLNISGKLIAQFKDDNNTGNSIFIDLRQSEDIPAGTYMIKVQSDEEVTYKKVILQ